MAAPTQIVTQTLLLRGQVTVDVTAQTTGCDRLVITPCVRANNDGIPELLGSLQLVHTLTGLSVAQDDYPGRLSDLALRLREFDWEFTTKEHVEQPQNAAAAKAIRETIRTWQLSDAWAGAHFIDDTDEKKAARDRDPVGTFLLEHLDWWMKHSKKLWGDEGRELREKNMQAWSAEVNLSCEGYGVIYLLAVLQRIDPEVAAAATNSLVVNLDDGAMLGELIWQWHAELTAGKPLYLHGIPDNSPLAACSSGTTATDPS